MIPSLDTYVYTSINKTLKLILRHEHIVRQSLANLDEEARENFITMFCGETPNSRVELSYSFPQAQQNFHARIVVQLGSSQKVNASLGNVDDTFDYREHGTVREVSTIRLKPDDDTRLEMPLENDIGDLLSVGTISFATSDEVKYEGKSVTFNRQYNDMLIGKQVKVTYIVKDPSPKSTEPVGVKKGYTTRDRVQITPMSTNMDIARCLDALLKVVIIMLQESLEEQTAYLLQDHEFGEMQQLAFDDNPDNTVYGRPMRLSYTVANTIDYEFKRQLEELIIHNRNL